MQRKSWGNSHRPNLGHMPNPEPTTVARIGELQLIKSVMRVEGRSQIHQSWSGLSLRKLVWYLANRNEQQTSVPDSRIRNRLWERKG